MLNVFSTKLKDYFKTLLLCRRNARSVNSYIENKDLSEVRIIQKRLLDAV